LEVNFHSLLFATQGLDLAIPSRSSYVDVGKHKRCNSDNGVRLKRCDPKLDPRALGDDIKMECPRRHGTISVRFLGPEDDPDKLDPEAKDDAKLLQRLDGLTDLEKDNGIILDVDKRPLKESDHAELWMGGSSPEESEAVCVRLGKESLKPPRVSCTTRIVPQQRFVGISKPDESRPNLIVILIDPLSRQQMQRSLPNTHALLNMLGFTEFEQYTAVGNNSGPNQAALYSGMPITGRDGIRTSSSHKAGRKWIWDRLNDEGYVTMKAEDGCIANSNMVQSIQPETHHGGQMHEMFCFDYDRPNCLGSQLAAEHLIQYTRQFIATYNRKDGEQSIYHRPWAAFLSFIDSHEDTLTLASYVDDLLVDFIQDVPIQNTLFLFTSDHGLHYGSTFQSTAAKIERANPLLHIRLPSFGKGDIFRAQSKLFVTPFDVHETILDVVLGSRLSESIGEDPHGISLMSSLPPNRLKCNTTLSIPSDFCHLFELKTDSCEFMTDAPSIFSYYSDIPRQNRPTWPDKCPTRRDHKFRAFQDDQSHCLCATNEREWFPCANITREEFREGVNFSVDNFSMRSCRNHDLDRSLEFDIHVKENELVSANSSTRSKATAKEMSDVYGDTEVRSSFQAQPNIIFLEIDSVSLSFSERHFPRTWGLLNHHKILTPNGGRTETKCPTGWCAATFNKTSVVGQNSIVNQLAALSGCMDQPWDSEDMIHYSRDGKDTYCPKSGPFNYDEYNFDGDDDVSHFHWIFAVARKLGYVTFFGEEFCYEDSPYVVQGQSVFDLDVDLSLEKIFCHLARIELMFDGLLNSERLFGVEYDTKNIPDACFDGKSRGDIGLELISQMWDAYSARPKFAFLNALAAHDYSLDAAHMPLGAEKYDKAVAGFLTKIMDSNEEKETFIFLRSDHGLQGGPFPIEYSTQIEHMHPWTAIITPSEHHTIDLAAFSSNQHRLITGFDIYHTLRYLMSPRIANNDERKDFGVLFNEGIPPWSFNIFRDSISTTRNCIDAKIPIDFCPCTSERIDLNPNFYVGHSEKKLTHPELEYDLNSTKFRAKRSFGVSKSTVHERPSIHYKDTSSTLDCKSNLSIEAYIDKTVLDLIGEISMSYKTLGKNKQINLHPLQSVLLTHIVQQEAFTKKSKNFRVCQTGFDSGEASALFLLASMNVQVVVFDSFSEPLQSASFLAIQQVFGMDRLMRVVGDSCKTLLKFEKRCDFLHRSISSGCQSDSINLIKMSAAGTTLTSAATESLSNNDTYFGPNSQWGTLFKLNCISHMKCFHEGYKNNLTSNELSSNSSHYFCIALNTGVCSEVNWSTRWPGIWKRREFCPDWRIPYNPTLTFSPEFEDRNNSTK